MSVHLSQITPSIFASLSLDGAQDFLGMGESPGGRELLFLIDGLGADAIEKYGEFAPAISRLHNFGKIQTSFPSTTATSLATLTTGELPGVHGMLGYTVQVPRSGGRILNALKWDERVDPINWQSVPTLFEKGTEAGISVSHVAAKRYENSGFTRAVFRGAQYLGANVATDMIAQTKAALKQTPSFVYLYLNDLDVAGHSDGVGSEKWIAALSMIDAMYASLVKELPSKTRIWLTADHGMVSATKKIIIGLDNPLAEGISVIAGEPRARHLYLDPSRDSKAARDEVAMQWREFLKEDAQVFTREEAIEAQLFGSQISQESFDRMGEVIAIAQGGVVLIEQSREGKEGAMVGHHGGNSEIESQVPLLTTTLN